MSDESQESNLDQSCPTAATLRRIIETPTESPTEAELLKHLDGCESCQRNLEKMAGSRAMSDEWKPALAGAMFSSDGGSSESPSLSDLVDHLKRHPAPVETQRLTKDELNFLRPSDAPNSIGRIGNYEVIDIIAQGGMGIVLRAIDPELKREVAIKVLSPMLAVAEGAGTRFLREARAVASLDHPNVLPIFGVGDEDSLPYLVMPLVNGESLQERIAREGAFSVDELRIVGAKIARGLDAAHRSGLVHRDVKPANVLLDADRQRVWITDFGLARTAEGGAVSRTGLIAGTPQFMAPEQFETADVDARADLFSLGGVLYAMATGKAPFAGDSAVSAMRSVCDSQPERPDRINPKIPGWLADQIMALLEKLPEDRPDSAAFVADLLEKGEMDRTSSPNGMRRALLGGLAIVGVIAIGWGGRGYWQSRSDSKLPYRIGESGFDTLSTAIEAAADGDTIYIVRDSMEFLEESLAVKGKSLRVVAGKAASPAILELSIAGDDPAFATDSPLILEGITLKNLTNDSVGSLITSSSDLYLHNCRLTSAEPLRSLGRDETTSYALVKFSGAGIFEAVNCESYAPSATGIYVSDVPVGEQRSIHHRNCATLVVDAVRMRDCAGEVQWVGDRSFFAGRSGVLAVTSGVPVRLHARMDHCVFGFKGTVIGQAGMRRQDFRESSSWQGDANLYANTEIFLKSRPAVTMRRNRQNVESLSDWIDFWNREETRASYTVVRLRDQFVYEQIPRNVDDIEAIIHLQMPAEVTEAAVDKNLGPDLMLLGQGKQFQSVIAADPGAYSKWVERASGKTALP